MNELVKLLVLGAGFYLAFKLLPVKLPSTRPKVKRNLMSDNSTCKYCGFADYGQGCVYSPSGNHEHNDGSDHCEYCGDIGYGSGCNYSPTRKHKHGIGDGKCRWCGFKDSGQGCVFSPTGYHEK